MRRLGPLLLAALLFAPGAARAERLVISLSENRVAIGSNYTGTQLVLYGIVEADPQTVGRAGGLDVVATVRGPREALTVRRKEPLGPLWLNRGQQKFVAVPAVLNVVASAPVDEIANPALRGRLRLGLRAVVDAPEFTFDRGVEDNPYRTALIRLKTRDGLWSENPRGVVFVTPAFFRARLPLPGAVPTGNYDVEVMLFSGETLLSRRNASFEVVKTGFEEQVTTAAQDGSLVYGLALAGLSLGFGWIASVIFRRD